MKPQSFLSAAELELTEQERDALVKVLELFESDGAPKTIEGKDEKLVWEPSFLNMFGFSHIYSKTDCGTAGCIWGWAKYLAHDDILFYRFDLPASLRSLFGVAGAESDFRSGHCLNGWVINTYNGPTTQQAAMAIRNYLMTGRPNWEGVKQVSQLLNFGV